jgi:hypothetical protein
MREKLLLGPNPELADVFVGGPLHLGATEFQAVIRNAKPNILAM